MGLFDRIAGRVGYEKAKIAAPPWALATANAQRWELPDPGLYENQSELYQQLSWVQSAVRLRAQSAASVELSVKKRQGEETEDIENHPFEELLQRPNPLVSRFQLLESLFAFRALTGNAYMWINAPTPGAPPTELWPIMPYKINPVPDGNLYLKGYVYTEQGIEIPLSVEEVVAFPIFNPLNPFVGLSPIEAIAKTAVGDIQAQKYNVEWFSEDNAKVPGALAFKSMVPTADWERIKAEWKERHGGTKRKTAFIRGAGTDGVQWIQMGLSQKDMEFIQGRQFNRQEIYELYGVPTGLFSELSGKASGGTAKAVFSEYTLWPELVSIAETITNQLLPRYGDNLVAAFDDVRISDQKLELDQLNTRKDYWTIDELRASEDMEPIGDERGELTVVELKAGKTGGEVPEQLQDFVGPNGKPPEEEVIEEEPPEEPTPKPEEPKAYAGDLRKWRKKAIRLLKDKGTAIGAFKSEVIPPEVQNAITAKLVSARSNEDVYAAFPAEISEKENGTGGGEPPNAAMLKLAAALNNAAKAVETPSPPPEPVPPTVHYHVKEDELPPNVIVNVPDSPPPVVNVTNEVAAPEVTVTNEVAVPEVNVEAPEVTVTNETQEPDSEIAVVKRDKKGRIQEVRKKRKYT